MEEREARRERLLELTINLVLNVRAQYLAGPEANPLKHWDQIQDRLRAVVRQCETVEEAVTSLCRSLRLGAPRSLLSRSIEELATFVGRDAGPWLELLEREYALVIARARLVAEARQAERAAAALLEEEG